MLDNLEHNRKVRNGRDGPFTTVTPSTGLGNTNPAATLGSTFGSGAPVILHGRRGVGKSVALQELVEGLDPVLAVQGGSIVVAHSIGGRVVLFENSAAESKVLRPEGQVVLFKKVMDQWDFSDEEAAMLLGFEDAADIQDIYEGRKPVGHRDANDRLRAVLRIAADIDALYDDKDAIRGWLNEPQRDLGGKTPRALLTEGSMENLLQVKYYVAHLSGR